MTASPEFFSQYGQDKYVWENLISPRKKSFFIEIGAHDGLLHSNTVFFEKCCGFEGAVVEPNPSMWSKLENNRNARVFRCGVGPNDGSMGFIRCTGYGEQLSCFKAFASEDHLDRIKIEQASHNFSVVEELIPVRSINGILVELGRNEIELLSVDVEGAEDLILSCIPFDEIRIRVIVVEANRPFEVYRLLASKGFWLSAIIGTDMIFAST